MSQQFRQNYINSTQFQPRSQSENTNQKLDPEKFLKVHKIKDPNLQKQSNYSGSSSNLDSIFNDPQEFLIFSLMENFILNSKFRLMKTLLVLGESSSTEKEEINQIGTKFESHFKNDEQYHTNYLTRKILYYLFLSKNYTLKRIISNIKSQMNLKSLINNLEQFLQMKILIFPDCNQQYSTVNNINDQLVVFMTGDQKQYGSSKSIKKILYNYEQYSYLSNVQQKQMENQFILNEQLISNYQTELEKVQNSLKLENKNLQIQLKNSEQKKQEGQNNLISIEKTNGLLKYQLQKQSEENENLNLKLNNLSQQLEFVQKQEENTNLNFNKEKKQLQSQLQNYQKLQSEHQNLEKSNEIEDLNLKLKTVNQQNEQLNEQLAQKQEQNIILKKDNENLTIKLQSQNENKARELELEEIINKQNENEKQLFEKYRSLQIVNREKYNENYQLKLKQEQLEKLKQTNTKFKQQLEETQQKYDILQQEYKTQIKEKDKLLQENFQIKQQGQINHKNQMEFNNFSPVNIHKNSEREELQEIYENKCRLLNEAQNNLKNERQKHENLKTQVFAYNKQQETEINNLKQQLDQKVQAHKSLIQNNNQLKVEINQQKQLYQSKIEDQLKEINSLKLQSRDQQNLQNQKTKFEKNNYLSQPQENSQLKLSQVDKFQQQQQQSMQGQASSYMYYDQQIQEQNSDYCILSKNHSEQNSNNIQSYNIKQIKKDLNIQKYMICPKCLISHGKVNVENYYCNCSQRFCAKCSVNVELIRNHDNSYHREGCSYKKKSLKKKDYACKVCQKGNYCQHPVSYDEFLLEVHQKKFPKQY